MNDSNATNPQRDQGVSLEFVATLLDDAACRWELSNEQRALLFMCAETSQRLSNELHQAADEDEAALELPGGAA